MAKAKWTVGAPTRTVAAGTATVVVPLLDTGMQQGTLTFTMTDARVLTVTWMQDPGTEPVTFAAAWSNV